ncbi:MAG: lysophospholipid acyltransferase family protein [Aquificaceae bacterium]
MRRIRYLFVKTLLPVLALLVKLWGKTIRWEGGYPFELDMGKIYAIWHGNSLGIAFFGMDKGIYTLVSRFRDGDLADYILKRLGYKVVRGSTEGGRAEKGGRTAIRRLMDIIKEKGNVAITVDGPKGPAFRVKDGIIFLAKKTSSPIVPAFAEFDRFIVLSSWDKFVVPIPFTRGRVHVGRIIYVKEDDSIELKVKELEEELLRLSSLGRAFGQAKERVQS